MTPPPESLPEPVLKATPYPTDSPAAAGLAGDAQFEANQAQPGASGALARSTHFVREVLQVLLPAIVLAIVVHLFLAQATVVFGQSMEPNLEPQQRLIVEKISLRLGGAPHRNDIIVLDLPQMDELLVKRIVGMPGERIEIRDGAVLVDGKRLAEPFPHDLGHTSMAPLILGPLEYFVMGDNRDNSNDSRAFGPVHRDEIVGRVWLRYWPLGQVTLF